MKVILILVDGMRPDAIAEHPQVKDMMTAASYAMDAQTVFPSVTLPCHMSLFHSVDPSRHGTTTNVYMPQVRPIDGLCEVLRRADKTAAFFYNWEELRDLARPASLTHSYFCQGKRFGYDEANRRITDAAISWLTQNETDFAFLFLGYTDAAGHKFGWMSQEYLAAVEESWRDIGRLVEALSNDYAVIVTADHGGHDRTHGADIPEDMTIPMVVLFKGEKRELDLQNATILDIAPTIAQLLHVRADEEWEGKSLLK